LRLRRLRLGRLIMGLAFLQLESGGFLKTEAGGFLELERSFESEIGTAVVGVAAAHASAIASARRSSAAVAMVKRNAATVTAERVD